jgi:hypothetical protein
VSECVDGMVDESVWFFVTMIRCWQRRVGRGNRGNCKHKCKATIHTHHGSAGKVLKIICGSGVPTTSVVAVVVLVVLPIGVPTTSADGRGSRVPAVVLPSGVPTTSAGGRGSRVPAAGVPPTGMRQPGVPCLRSIISRPTHTCASTMSTSPVNHAKLQHHCTINMSGNINHTQLAKLLNGAQVPRSSDEPSSTLLSKRKRQSFWYNERNTNRH